MMCKKLPPSISFRVPPNDLVEYPSWIILYFYHNILPMLGVSAIAMKIILKNGKDLRREIIGVKFNPNFVVPSRTSPIPPNLPL